MALGDALQKRLEELQKKDPYIRQWLRDIAYGATLRAVEEATEHTPPNDDDKMRGAGTITGELAQHWADDSKVYPINIGSEYRTVLANNVEYASYVNFGHYMSQHFVPGLVINPRNNLLERVPPVYTDEKGKKHVIGIVVGTKTHEVKGVYMLEKGLDKYKEVADAELIKFFGEVFGP